MYKKSIAFPARLLVLVLFLAVTLVPTFAKVEPVFAGGPVTGGAATNASVSPAATGDCGTFVRDVNYPDYSYVSKNTTITKTWLLHNCGTTNWQGYTVRKQYGIMGPGSFTLESVS